jgi:hypothetical protein
MYCCSAGVIGSRRLPPAFQDPLRLIPFGCALFAQQGEILVVQELIHRYRVAARALNRARLLPIGFRWLGGRLGSCFAVHGSRLYLNA